MIEKKTPLQIKIKKAKVKVEGSVPKDKESEKVFLGCIFLDNKLLYEVPELKPDMFFYSGHQKIYKAMLSLLEKKEHIDVATVNSEMSIQDKEGEMTDGDLFYAMDLYSEVNSIAPFMTHAKRIIKSWKLRELIENAQKMGVAAMAPEASPEELSQNLWRQVNSLELSGLTLYTTSSGEFEKTRPKLMRERKLDTRVILTGWESVNNLLFQGFVPGNISVLAGRPGLGKTTMKMNLINYWGFLGLGVYDYTPEQGVELERDCLLSNITGVPVEYLQNPREFIFDDRVNEKIYRDKILEGEQILDHDFRLCIDGTRGRSFAQLIYELERWKINNPLAVLVIDLIGNLREVSTEVQNKANILSALLNQQAEVAQRLNIHILNVWQIHRINRDNKRPQLDDLKDSGAAEEVSDLILLAYREKYYDPSSPDDSTELRVAKQRGGGETGVAKLKFEKPNRLVDYVDFEEEKEEKNEEKFDLF